MRPAADTFDDLYAKRQGAYVKDESDEGFLDGLNAYLEPRHLDAKVAALHCYESQQHRNYANEEYIRNLARTHGIVSGRELAEAFEVYRLIA